ncbi:hypothetical protein, partial [Kaarinaea lacus]
PEPDDKITPIKKLPSGTLVNTLSDNSLSGDDKFVNIETKDGITGWIKSIYLTNEKPTQIEYLQLAAKYSAAEAKIQDYETRLLDMQELRKEAKTADWLRNQLNENKKRENAYEQQIKLKDIALADLRITVANLEDQLANAGIKNSENPENSSVTTQQTLTSGVIDDSGTFANSSSIRFYTWLVLSLAVTLIIGVLLGFVLIDSKVRKKSSMAKEA